MGVWQIPTYRLPKKISEARRATPKAEAKAEVELNLNLLESRLERGELAQRSICGY